MQEMDVGMWVERDTLIQNIALQPMASAFISGVRAQHVSPTRAFHPASVNATTEEHSWIEQSVDSQMEEKCIDTLKAHCA